MQAKGATGTFEEIVLVRQAIGLLFNRRVDEGVSVKGKIILFHVFRYVVMYFYGLMQEVAFVNLLHGKVFVCLVMVL